MKTRPMSVIVVSVLFIVVGGAGLIAGVLPVITGKAVHRHDLIDSALVSVSGLIAVVSGVFMLRGANWARWLCVVWLLFHVAISVSHTKLKLLLHCVFLIVVVLILWRPRASAYFRSPD